MRFWPTYSRIWASREAQDAVAKWNEATGAQLSLPDIPPLPRPGAVDVPAVAQPPRRICCCDINFTFFGKFVPEGIQVKDWFSQPHGMALVDKFLEPRPNQSMLLLPLLLLLRLHRERLPVFASSFCMSGKDWARRVFPARFNEPLLHTSLTLEESLMSERPRVHLHVQFTFQRKIHRTCPVMERVLFPACYSLAP